MRKSLYFLLLFFALPLFSAAQITTVNTIIGDESFVKTFGRAPNENDADWLRIRTHLAYAEKILRERDRPDLSPELQQKRLHLLDLLDDYVANGKFPENADHPEERRPCFIDAKGTICAVGYLVEQTEGHDKAETINKNFQYATINEMHSEWLNGWMQRWGLSAEEAATIQPTYHSFKRLPPIAFPSWYNKATDPTVIVRELETRSLPEGKPSDTTNASFVLSKKGTAKNISVSGNDPVFNEAVRQLIAGNRMRPRYSRKKFHQTRARFKGYPIHYTLIRSNITDTSATSGGTTSYNPVVPQPSPTADTARLHLKLVTYSGSAVLAQIVDAKNNVLFRQPVFCKLYGKDQYEADTTILIHLQGSNQVRFRYTIDSLSIQDSQLFELMDEGRAQFNGRITGKGAARKGYGYSSYYGVAAKPIAATDTAQLRLDLRIQSNSETPVLVKIIDANNHLLYRNTTKCSNMTGYGVCTADTTLHLRLQGSNKITIQYFAEGMMSGGTQTFDLCRNGTASFYAPLTNMRTRGNSDGGLSITYQIVSWPKNFIRKND